MRTAWIRASILLVGSLLALSAALWLVRSVRAQARLPQLLESAQQAFVAGGGEQGLAERERLLTEMHARLQRERAAMSSDAELFSRRVGETFAKLDLAVTTSSGWRAAPDLAGGQGVAFTRSFSGSGAFAALLDALRSIESWPDRARVRSLVVAPEAPGTVAFTVEIAAVRLEPQANDDQS